MHGGHNHQLNSSTLSQTDKTLNSNVIFGRLVTQLEDRVKSVSEEISSLEGVDKRLEELLEKISRLSRQVEGVKAWEQDHSNIEDKLAVSQYQHSVQKGSQHRN